MVKGLTEEKRAVVTEAVATAETKTSAEIIPVVIGSSDDHGYYEALFGFFLSIVSVATVWYLLQSVTLNERGWGQAVTLGFGLLPLIATMVVAFIVGVLIARAFPAIVRPLVPPKRRNSAAHTAAVELFHRFRLTRTNARTSVLICVCLFERRVVVLGDLAISETLNQEDWDGVRDSVLEGVKSKDLKGGLIAGIENAGALLAQHFPADTDNPDEVTNELRVLV